MPQDGAPLPPSQFPSHDRGASTSGHAAQDEISGESDSGWLFADAHKARPYWLHVLLFLLTVLSTLIVGARLQHQFTTNQPIFIQDDRYFAVSDAWRDPRSLLNGIPFTASLLAILLAHEFGHFIYCKRNRVYATLPFFLPFPSPIGTLGAFIQIRSPFESLAGLFDIAIAGPLAGLAAAVPLAFVGLSMSKVAAPGSGLQMGVGNPLIFHLIHRAMVAVGATPQVALSSVYMHPVAVAAWTGMLATSLNLLPGGQLDGGHMIYARWPNAHRRTTRAALLALVPLGLFFWSGWLVWAGALFFTSRHPYVDVYPPLDGKRRMMFWLAVGMLVLTFVPMPFAEVGAGSIIREWIHRR